MKKIFKIITIIIVAIFTIMYYEEDIKSFLDELIPSSVSYSIEEIPEYNGEDFIIINDNKPEFDTNDITIETFEKYSKLDYLDRAGYAYANISKDLMPTEERESIGSIKPSGWQTIKYDIVPGKYLYNRCHLIGYQLTGENKNERNLITCTRQMNTTGMLEWENKVANYIKETNNHVLYRVTPIYKEEELLARGVQIEAYSIEDKGKGVEFNVFIYNVQDGININYLDGTSTLDNLE